MRRVLILIVLTLAVLQLKADEVWIRVTEDTPGWRSGTFFINDDTITKIIEKNTIGVGDYLPLLSKINDQPTPLITLIIDGVVYSIDANYAVPAGTEELVPQSLLTNWEDPDRKVWLLTHYIDVLRSGTRDTLRPFEDEHIKDTDEMRRTDEYYNNQWYDYDIEESFTIFQTGLRLGGIFTKALWIINVKTLPDGLRLTVRYPDYRPSEPPIVFNKKALSALPLRNDPTPFDLYLIPDGDFLDIYIHDTDTLLTTLFHADQHVLKTLNHLIKYNRADISGITWPRRADGSSPYQEIIITPPEVGKSYRTTVNLRMRRSQDTSSDILLTMPEDTVVQILEIGTQDRINAIDSFWVKVRLEDGTSGWCFAGYLHGPLLESVPASTDEQTDSVVSLEAENPANSDNDTGAVEGQRGMFFIGLFVIVGLLLTISIMLTLVMIKRKKAVNSADTESV